MQKIGVSSAGIAIMQNRFSMLSFVVHDISATGANVLKQHLLHVGGEVAVSRETIAEADKKVTALCSLPFDKIPQVAERLKQQWWHLPEIADFLEGCLKEDSPWFGFRSPLIDTTRPAIMGILNVTPDSFSDGGKYRTVESAIEAATAMIKAGADIIDIGGESSRPGADAVTESEEIKRVIPIIRELSQSFPDIPLSIDTIKASVARQALKVGASIVNNIDGLHDPDLARVVADHDAILILMHMQGSPRTMQQNPQYDNFFTDITVSLEKSVERACEAGLSRKKIIIDPGIGFGKTVDNNLSIIKHLEWLTAMKLPLLIGASRKSVIGAVTGVHIASERVAGTVALHTMALEKGAAILRVHDVPEAVQGAQIFSAVRGAPCC